MLKENLQTITILGILTFLITSCDKKKDSERLEFPMKYSFYNEGDPNLMNVSISCQTCYPTEELLILQGRGKHRDVHPWEYDLQLQDFDSIEVYPEKYVYPSCTFLYQIVVRFVNNEGVLQRKIYLTGDTIGVYTNMEVRFRWPYDSINYTESQ